YTKTRRALHGRRPFYFGTPLPTPGVRDDGVARLFSDHVDGAENEQAGDPWEYRSVHHPQAFGAAHPEIAVEHRHRVVRAADLAGAAGMVAPGIVLDEIAQLVARAYLRAGHDLVEDARGPPRDLAHELDAGDDAVKVVLPGAVAVVEISEIDARRVVRLLRLQPYAAGGVVGVALEDVPGEERAAASPRGIAGAIAGEMAGDRAQEQIRVVRADMRTLDDRGDRAVGGVEAVAVLPLGELGIAAAQLRVAQQLERLLHAMHDADLVAVLEVLADAWQRDLDIDLDVLSAQLVRRADARQHQELRRVEGAARQDHFVARLDRAPRRGERPVRRMRVGAVEMRALSDLDAGRALVGVELDPQRQRVGGDREIA